jgi:hypothetical protein
MLWEGVVFLDEEGFGFRFNGASLDRTCGCGPRRFRDGLSIA